MSKQSSFSYLVFLIVLFCLTSCAVTPIVVTNQEKLLLLENELIRWNTFRITGFTELQYQAFSIRGQAVIAKTDDKFRFDILSQGILGLGGGVLVAVYVDSEQIQTRMFGSSAVETYEFDSQIGNMVSFLSENLQDLIYSQREAILETYRCELEGFEITFSQEMRLIEVHSSENDIRVNFIYDRQDNLTEMRIATPITRNFIIQVDKTEHENIVVNPLRIAG